ncbi:vWA domain-containing protein [Chitinophaga barathri]|nr:vWA domain-containing protein [Chitinophaga barathri]
MKPKVKNLLQMFRQLYLYILVMCLPILAKGQEVINVNVANAPHVYNLPISTLINPDLTIGPGGTGGMVLWEFAAAFPGGAVALPGGDGFTKDGLQIKLPAAENVPISDVEKVIISGTPTVAGSWSFSLRVTDQASSNNGTRVFEVHVTQSLDLVLVLDRSGSMLLPTSADPGAPSRWNALKEAVGNFANLYQAIGGTNRLGITYFATTPAPVSTCCGALRLVDGTLATAVGTDIDNVAVTPVPAGMTAMGAGLKTATTTLSDITKARSILVFTDGEQNQLPEVNLAGTGYSDGTTIPGGPAAGGIKIATIGIGSPSGNFHTTLMAMATANRGSYNTTLDGTNFAFQGGLASGSLSMGFVNQFVTMLSQFSPQIVTTAFKPLPPSGAVLLETFPLNKRVDKLLLEFTVGRKLEVPQLLQVYKGIRIEKDGADVKRYAQPSWVGNYTNTILLTIDFSKSPEGYPLLDPAGKWTVHAADSNMNLKNVNLNVLADDHRLHMKRTLGNATPKVKDKLSVSFLLDKLQLPVTDADVKIYVYRPDQDLGHELAINDKNIKPDGTDSASAGVQKYNKLWETDSAFRALFKPVENIVQLNHTTDGKYEGSYDDLSVAGVYKLVYVIKAKNDDIGEFQRTFMESVYVTFSGVDLTKSEVTSTVQNGQLVMVLRPMTNYGKYIGPAMGPAFSVSNKDIKIASVVDHQDGKYTITFTGAIDQPTKLSILGQEVYSGKLENAGKSDSFIDKIKKWLESIGLPAWSIWIILLLILLLLWLLFRKKKP